MKKSIYLILALICSLGSFAQTPGTFNYQAVVRDASGVIFSNQPVIIDLAIVKDSVDGLIMYEETWDTVTSTLGLVNLEIGSKDIQSFKNLNWMYGPFFISISVNNEFLGTSQLLSVPFAQLAQRVVEGGANDADADSTNEIQDISLTGDQLSISGGSTVTLPDTDSTNEIQDISLTGDQLSISGGSTVTLHGVDESPTLTISGHRLSISNGNTVILPDRYNDNDSNPTNEIELPTQTAGDADKSLVADGAGNVSWKAGTVDTKLSETDVDAFVANNGYQLSDDDGDTDAANEIQILSISNDTLFLSDGDTVKLPAETDPEYSAWDKTTGISITESQISDLDHYTDSDIDGNETAFDDWDKDATDDFDGTYSSLDTTGLQITESQISDLTHFTNSDETDPEYSAWDKTTGISITESQISDLDHYTDSDIDGNETAFDDWDKDATDDFDGTYSSLDTTGLQITESQISDLTHFTNSDETDPEYSAWDKTTGISITESQISDLDHYTDSDIDGNETAFDDWDKDATDDFDGTYSSLDTTGLQITESQISDLTHFTNSDETDPVYSAWDKTTGISITESQISDLDHYTDSDIDGNETVFDDWDKDATDDFDGTYSSLDTTGLQITESQISDLDHYTDSDIDGNETAFNDWDKDATDDFDGTYSSLDTTGLQITESQISDLTHFTNSDETDPVYSAWDKTTGISITESQISDLDHYTDSDIDGNETAFDGWDKDATDDFDGTYSSLDTTGLQITESQISDLTHFTNSDETDPVYSAWDKTTGISITESQISDLDHYTDSDIDGNETAFVGWDKDSSDDFDGTYSSLSGAPTNVSTFTNDAGYLTSAPVPTGTQTGQMQYWDGSEWITVAAGTEGQVLTFSGGVPTWKPLLEDGDVKNSTTGKIWMDRNLGASQVATSSTDVSSYGDLYQWGRGTDGHQIRTSVTTPTLATSDTPGHSNFITSSVGDNYDWRSSQNDDLWQGVSGTNNPCPSGYRLPTQAEWEAERASWGSNDAAGAFDSPLKLPVAGYRLSNSGSPFLAGSSGLYWSSTVSGTDAHRLTFSGSSDFVNTLGRAYGLSVRCIKN